MENVPKAIPKERLPPGADISIATNVLPTDLIPTTKTTDTTETNNEDNDPSSSSDAFKLETHENNDISYPQEMGTY